MMRPLTLAELKLAARDFVRELSLTPIADLYGATDGKAIGTYVEQKFHRFLQEHFSHSPGSSASGIDFPDLGVDLKATSIRQPQSSCPFREASQKVYGLGYHLMVFVYEKADDTATATARLTIRHAIFVSREKTGDYQTTRGLRELLACSANQDDIIAFLEERHLPLEEVGRTLLAERILREPPELGYLTVSNALQWRLQYRRVINAAVGGEIDGVEQLHG
jgi:hypothetical protein